MSPVSAFVDTQYQGHGFDGHHPLIRNARTYAHVCAQSGATSTDEPLTTQEVASKFISYCMHADYMRAIQPTDPIAFPVATHSLALIPLGGTFGFKLDLVTPDPDARDPEARYDWIPLQPWSRNGRELETVPVNGFLYRVFRPGWLKGEVGHRQVVYVRTELDAWAVFTTFHLCEQPSCVQHARRTRAQKMRESAARST